MKLKIGIIKYHIKRINQFDEITQFRLKSLIIVTLLVDLIIPIYSQYYNLLKIGTIEAATILAFFGILKKIGTKLTIFVMNNFSFSNIFLGVIITDILWILSSLTYFISPQCMVWSDLFVSVLQLPFLFAFSNSLNNYINYFYPKKYTLFQNYENDIFAEIGILGLIFSVILTSISIGLTIIVFSIGMFFNTIYQIKNFNLFKKYNFRYMFNYKKSLK